MLDLPVRDVMTARPRCVDVREDLSDVWTEMLNGGFHHVPVLQEGQLVGILSASDLRALIRAMPEELQETGVILAEQTIGGLMSPEPDRVDAHDTVRDVAEAFASGRYHALPVCEGDAVVGIVTTTDLVRWMLR
jgi:CBS domain-containing protein